VTSASWFQDEHALLDVGRRARAATRAPVIPGYDDLHELRRGGQGVVFSAVQRSTRQKVAIKVLLAGALASPAQRRRFEREAELAASLRHPAIVRILDSGVTADAFAYIVMEFVEGAPLAVPPADLTSLDGDALRPRLAIFEQVCDAVSHAHQRGVIHRDLKPANILIEPTGQPRVLDFGLAKPAGENLTETLEVSRQGQFVGSLPWASPEQVRAETLDVRSDVYSLGVILYQLLTGRLPYELGSDFAQALHAITSADPVPPRRLVRSVSEDLQTVVVACLAKDPARRYQAAADLRDDVRAVLAGEAIRARRDSAWYTLRRRAARYRTVAWAVGAVALAASAMLAVTLRSERRAARAAVVAQQESDNARAVTDFVGGMLASPDPRLEGREVKVADVLDRAAHSVGGELAGKPRSEAGVRAAIAAGYHALGLEDEALQQYRLAEQLARAESGPEGDETLTCLSGQAAVLVALGQAREALPLAQQAAETRLKTLGPEDRRTLDAQSVYATALGAAGKADEAIALKRQLVAHQERLRGPDHRDTLNELNNLAASLLQTGKPGEAQAVLETLVERERSGQGAEHPDTLCSMVNLASVYKTQGRITDAESLLRQVCLAAPKVFGPDHPETLIAEGNWGDLLMNLERFQEARDVLAQCVEKQRRVFGAESPRLVATMLNLGSAERGLTHYDRAEVAMRDAADLAARTLGPTHPRTLASRGNLGELLLTAGRTDDGAAILEDVLPKAKAALGEDHWACGAYAANLARARQIQGRPDDERQLLEYAFKVMRARLGPTHDRTESVAKSLAQAARTAGDEALAGQWDRAAVGGEPPSP